MKLFLSIVIFIICQPGNATQNDERKTQSKQPHQKAILVTGASSGIGRNITETLAANGHFVYAGARKQSDLDSLSAIKNVQGVKLDVTIQEDIDNAVDFVRSQNRGLYAIVNNAGVAVFAPLIEASEKDMQFQMDVNLFGPYRITKAFAPLIIESKGRITTTGSIAGIVSGSLLGPYNMSKHAVEAFTDALSGEMKKFDVKVSVIEPGNYNSKVISNMKRRMDNKGAAGKSSLYRQEMQQLFTYFSEDRSNHKAPDDVSAAVVHALFDEKPKSRYMVVPIEREAQMTIRGALRKVVQLNENQPFSYNRKTLISMLDKELNRSK